MFLPSVTEVLQPWSSFHTIPKEVLHMASVRGDAVHLYVGNIARGMPVMGVPPEYAGYVESGRLWLDQMVVEVEAVEERLVDSDFQFHGQPDLIAILKDRKRILGDWKTGAIEQKTWPLQNAGYEILCDKRGIKIDRYGAIQLFRDGKIGKFLEYGSFITDRSLFLQAVNLWRYFHS